MSKFSLEFVPVSRVLATVAALLASSVASTARAAPGDDDDAGVEGPAAAPSTATGTTGTEITPPTDDGEEDGSADRRDVNGAEDTRLRVHVDSEAIGGAWSRVEGTADNPARDTISFGAGLARPSLLDNGAAVFSRPMFGLGLGYVFSDDRAIIGAKLSVTVDGYNLDDNTKTIAVGGRVAPYFQWMFRPERWFRPYLEARIGLGGSAAIRDVEGMGRASGQVLYPMAGAGGGFHMFPRDWFSIDLGLNVDYAAPFSRTTYRDDAQTDTEWDKTADVVNFGILIGMSTWF